MKWTTWVSLPTTTTDVHYDLDNGFRLRAPEPGDVPRLYAQKNDPEVAALLGGFSFGYSRRDIEEWIEFHRTRKDEIVWVIADAESDACVGHVGLYRIDQRVRSAEFAILIGDRDVWRRGLGRAATAHAIRYAFRELNLNRVHLSVLASNEPAAALYRSLGFRDEGVLRQGHYRNGEYIDVLVMGLLRAEWNEADDA